MSAVEKFPILLSEAEEESSAVPPCFSDEGINVRQKRHIERLETQSESQETRSTKQEGLRQRIVPIHPSFESIPPCPH